MKYQNKFGNRILNKIRPLGPDAAHGRTALLGWPCGGLPSWPTLERSPARHSLAGCRRRRAERVHTAPMRMERGERRGYRGVAGGRGAPARLRRARAPPRTLAGHLHDDGELVRRWDVGSGYGSPAARWFYGLQCLPCFRYGGEMTGGVWHSHQRRGLDKGAGSEALTGDGHRRGQRSGRVAVLSFSRWSCARRQVRVVGGCCSRGGSRRNQRMEELTGVARSTKMKQSETASGEVGKWRMASPSSSGAEIRPASTDTRSLCSGDSVAVRWRAAVQLSCARVASVRAAVERCWTLTSGPPAILNFQ
jgi:hypothetical protein